MIVKMEEYKKQDTPKYIKVCAIGGPGTGKTHFGGTFPKVFTIFTEPDSHLTYVNSPDISNNIYGWMYHIPTSEQDTEKYISELELAIDHARSLFKKGEIETLVIDNGSYLAQNFWIQINNFDKSFGSGGLDTRAMYGKLKDKLYKFVTMKCLTFPGNFVFTIHEQLESDENMAKKPDKSSPVVPQVLGSFRDQVEGLFSAVLFLQKQENRLAKDKAEHDQRPYLASSQADLDKRPYIYFAYTNRTQQRNAKNRFNLPKIIWDCSYQRLVNEINKNIGKVVKTDA